MVGAEGLAVVHPETISELLNEPKCHFQNLDFWIFSRTPLRTAPGQTTSRVEPLLKKILWVFQNIDIAQKKIEGSKIGDTHLIQPLKQPHERYTIYIYVSSETCFFRARVSDFLLIEKRLRRDYSESQ